MVLKCPGSSLDNKKPEEVVSYKKCSHCGYSVEMWYDEDKRKCPNPECEKVVYKNIEQLLEDFKCAKWCESAEECIGRGSYKTLQEFLKKED